MFPVFYFLMQYNILRALVHGAAISAFLTIAQGMTDQGCV
ncbi:hypothetical protein CK203_003096 [Vitis vinifera]|uniref:Uncharacterized protein n=1 Tax=Vitis vinifera TaxID=29760 RepID=A0A438K7E0_VITVI|nr:hypothetical protein CK203_003096 [Vitis vinifera]